MNCQAWCETAARQQGSCAAHIHSSQAPEQGQYIIKLTCYWIQRVSCKINRGAFRMISFLASLSRANPFPDPSVCLSVCLTWLTLRSGHWVCLLSIHLTPPPLRWSCTWGEFWLIFTKSIVLFPSLFSVRQSIAYHFPGNKNRFNLGQLDASRSFLRFLVKVPSCLEFQRVTPHGSWKLFSISLTK